MPHAPRRLHQVQAAHNVHVMLEERDPRIMELMKHESARLRTYHDWPYNTPHPKCLAKAGFFYFGDTDKVQCAYCLCVFTRWSPFDQPAMVHKAWQPNCPFVTKMPGAISYAQTTMMKKLKRRKPCCESSTMEDGWTKTKPVEKMNFLYYMIALYAVVSASGWQYVAADASTGSNVPTNGIKTVATWNGVVAVKKQEALLTQSFSKSHWNIDLTKCEQAWRAINAALNTTQEALPEFRKSTNNQQILAARDQLETWHVQKILQELPTVESTNSSTCKSPIFNMATIKECEFFKSEADQLAYSTPIFASVNTSNPDIATSLGALMGLVQRFSRYHEYIWQSIQTMKAGKMPEGAISFLNEQCPALVAQCDPPLNASASAIPFGRYVQPEQVNWVEQQGVWILQITLKTPCLYPSSSIGQYELLTLPYREQDQQTELALCNPADPWMKPDENGKMEVLPYTVHCTAQQDALAPLCVKGNLREENNTAGNEDFLTICADEEEPSQPTQVIQLPDRKMLVATTQEEANVETPCGKQSVIQKKDKDERSTLKEITLDNICAMKIPHVASEAIKTAVTSFLPNYVTFQKGKITSSGKNLFKSFLLKRVQAHLQENAEIYWIILGTLTVALLACVGWIYTPRREWLSSSQGASRTNEAHRNRLHTLTPKQRRKESRKVMYVRPLSPNQGGVVAMR